MKRNKILGTVDFATERRREWLAARRHPIYRAIAPVLRALEDRINAAFDDAVERISGVPCATCGGTGEMEAPTLETGPNLPPGGFYAPSGDFYPCPDCR